MPEVFWDYTLTNVMTMERMRGTPISHVDSLRAQGIDIPKLARAGRRDLLQPGVPRRLLPRRHAPGNIFVAADGALHRARLRHHGHADRPRQDYLAQNFLAFFKRDYKRVAQAHVEAGWVPPETRVDEFEAAVRAVCEPIFDRPLKEISFGRVLLRLFQTARRFNLEVQPQLVMLQKTLLNIEGLGRELDPDLDLWTTAKPYLERWMQRADRLARSRPHRPERGADLGEPPPAAAAPRAPRARRGPTGAHRGRARRARGRGAPAHAGGVGHRLVTGGVCHGRPLARPARLSEVRLAAAAARYFSFCD